MRPCGWTRGASFIGGAIALCLCVSTSACSTTKGLGGSSKSKSGAAPDKRTAAASHFVRVEDLPKAGYVKVDDLAPAAPVALRPLRGPELTPRLVQRAEDVLRHEEKPLGTQVVLELDAKKYIAKFEWHYDDESTPKRPFGWHKGVTLYSTE
jgi:hypothetical protein